MENKIYIYAFAEPNDETKIKYVGKTNNLTKRTWKHLNVFDRENIYKGNWIKRSQN